MNLKPKVFSLFLLSFTLVACDETEPSHSFEKPIKEQVVELSEIDVAFIN